MSRHKDKNWNLETAIDGRVNQWETVFAALLMDIRDELKSLNQVLHCGNCLDIPNILRNIEKNTKRRRQKKV